MKAIVYVERNLGQTVFDIVCGDFPPEFAHHSGVQTMAVAAAVIVCRDPKKYCNEGVLRESPQRTLKEIFKLSVALQNAVVRRMEADGLLVVKGNQASVVATDRVQALLAYIDMHNGRFQMFDNSTRQDLSAIAEAVRWKCSGDPLKVAAVAYMLLPTAGAPLP